MMKNTTRIKRCFLDTLPVLTGSMQYLTVSLLTSGASLIAAAIVCSAEFYG